MTNPEDVAPRVPDVGAAGTDTVEALDLKDFLSYRVSRLARVLDRIREVRLAKSYDLSLTESRVLGYLAVSEQITVRELAEEMCLDKAQVSRAANALVKLDYAQRRGDPIDRRSVMFSVTESGAEHYRSHLMQARQGQARLMGHLDSDELEVFNRAIDKLLAQARLDLPANSSDD